MTEDWLLQLNDKYQFDTVRRICVFYISCYHCIMQHRFSDAGKRTKLTANVSYHDITLLCY